MAQLTLDSASRLIGVPHQPSESTGTNESHTQVSKPAGDAMEITADSTPAAPAEALFFSRLPRELRDQIYRHAYEADEDGTFKMTSLSDYMRKERDRRKFGRTRLNPAPITPRETPVCPLLNMRVSKKFWEEATAAWFRHRVIECKERYVFNTICENSSTLRKCLAKFSCTWDSCHFVSDYMSEHCGAFVQLKRCKNIRTLTIEVNERAFEEFNRLSCVDTFTVNDFATIQEARDLLSLPLLSNLEMKPGKCSLGVTDQEKAKWGENVAALASYMKSKLAEQKLLREKQKAKEKAYMLERAKRKASKQKSKQRTTAVPSTPAAILRPAGLFARARNLLAFLPKRSSRTAPPTMQGPPSRNHPAVRPGPSRSATRASEWKASQDKIVKRAMSKREKKPPFLFMDRISDLEDAYAGIQEMFEVPAPPQQEPEGIVAFYKRYPLVVASLATTTTLSIVNSVALWKVLSQR